MAKKNGSTKSWRMSSRSFGVLIGRRFGRKEQSL
jgi:hypothetical protein